MIKEIISVFSNRIKELDNIILGMSDELLLSTPSGQVRPAAWIIGNTIVGMQQTARQFGIEPWLTHKWEKMFASTNHANGHKSQDNTNNLENKEETNNDSTEYPNKSHLLSTLHLSANLLINSIEEIPEEEWSKAPEDKDNHHFETKGAVLMNTMTSMVSVQIGQLIALRSYMGLPEVHSVLV